MSAFLVFAVAVVYHRATGQGGQLTPSVRGRVGVVSLTPLQVIRDGS